MVQEVHQIHLPLPLPLAIRKQLHDVDMALRGEPRGQGSVKRRLAVLVRAVEVGPVLEKQPHEIDMAISGGKVKRRPATWRRRLPGPRG